MVGEAQRTPHPTFRFQRKPTFSLKEEEKISAC